MAQESGQAEAAVPQRIVASKPGLYKVSYSTISSTGAPVSVRAPEWLPKVSVPRPLIDRWKAAREELKALGSLPNEPLRAPKSRKKAEAPSDWDQMLLGRGAKRAEAVPAADAAPATAMPAAETPVEAPPAEPSTEAVNAAAAEAAAAKAAAAEATAARAAALEEADAQAANARAANAAVAELRGQVDSLTKQLSATERERTRARNACNEAKEKVEFVQELYSESSTAAANLAEKSRAAEEEIARLRNQLQESIETLKRRHESELRTRALKVQLLQQQVNFLQQQHAATDSSVREKAALWDAQQEREQEMQRERQRHWERMEARHPGEGIPISQLSGAAGSAAPPPAAPEPTSIADELAELAAEAAENPETPPTTQRRSQRSHAPPPASTPTAASRATPALAETAKPPAEAPAAPDANGTAPHETSTPATPPRPPAEQTTPPSHPTAASAAASLASSALKRLMPGSASDDTPANASASAPNTPSRPRWKRRRRTADSGTTVSTPPPTQ